MKEGLFMLYVGTGDKTMIIMYKRYRVNLNSKLSQDMVSSLPHSEEWVKLTCFSTSEHGPD